MTSPSDHVSLLELLGWSFQPEGDRQTEGGWIAFPEYWRDEDGNCYEELPEKMQLSDSLLRTAREQLLTTDELRAQFLKALFSRYFSDSIRLTPETAYWLLHASAADQAAVLVGMRESFGK